MKNQLNLNIKTPCSENFNQFTPTPKGGFCRACDKEVIDFTKMNAEAIMTYFKHTSNQKTCGRFNNNQLKTYNLKPIKNRRLGFLSGIGLACLAFFSSFTTQAQDTKNLNQPKENTSEIKASKSKNNITVRGTVMEGGIPLPGVNIVLQGSTDGVATDFDGNFEFPKKLKIGDILIVSYIGMEAQKIVIENKDSASLIELNIDMKADSCIILGKVAVKEIYKSKRD